MRAMTRAAGSSVQTPSAGAVLAGKYRVERTLGEGGMGVVLACEDLFLRRPVAVKLMREASRVGQERFLREARIVAQLRSEHVCRVYDAGALPTGEPYIAMELLDGTDLEHLVATAGPVAVPALVGHVLQACEALAEAHLNGVVHRDIKPANLFLTRRGDGSPCVKLLDFGIAKIDEGGAGRLTAASAVFGTPRFMSPEQIGSTRDVDARTDIWALGVVLYEVASGRVAFDAPTAAEICIAVLRSAPPALAVTAPAAAALDPIIVRCLEKDPEARFANVAELALALAPLAAADTRHYVDRVVGQFAASGWRPPMAAVGPGSGDAHAQAPTGEWLAGSAPYASGVALTAGAVAASGVAPSAGAPSPAGATGGPRSSDAAGSPTAWGAQTALPMATAAPASPVAYAAPNALPVSAVHAAAPVAYAAPMAMPAAMPPRQAPATRSAKRWPFVVGALLIVGGGVGAGILIGRGSGAAAASAATATSTAARTASGSRSAQAPPAATAQAPSRSAAAPAVPPAPKRSFTWVEAASIMHELAALHPGPLQLRKVQFLDASVEIVFVAADQPENWQRRFLRSGVLGEAKPFEPDTVVTPAILAQYTVPLSALDLAVVPAIVDDAVRAWSKTAKEVHSVNLNAPLRHWSVLPLDGRQRVYDLAGRYLPGVK